MYVDSKLGENTHLIRYRKEQNTGQHTNYTLEWILVIKTSHGLLIPNVAAVDPI